MPGTVLGGVALFAAFTGIGCSGGDSEAARVTTSTTVAPTTTSTVRTWPTCDHFKVGEPIRDEETHGGYADLQGEPCVRTFDCAHGRIHVAARQGGQWTLEGFAPTDQRGHARADASDAVWQEHGSEYQNYGRTKLQSDCGG